MLSAVGYVVGIANSAPDLNSLTPQDPGRISTVFASDGKTELGKISNDVLRIQIASSEMPQSVRDATVAIEDQRFYQHRGVDFEGIIRAAIKNLNSGRTIQGGSTLSMQLIRTLYTDDRSRSLKRKIREAKLAEELENVHPGKAGKDWILTKYLNSVPYGTYNGKQAIGIQAAARSYFNKSAAKLTLAESALLAGLPQAPTDYSPFRHPTAAITRRNEVLRKMAELGYISDGAEQAAIAHPLELHPNSYFQEKREGFFFDYVTDELIKSYGEKVVRSGGLRITTTIDVDLNDKARAAIARSLNFERRTVVGDRQHRPAQRLHPRDGVLGEVRDVAVQPRRRQQAAARLGLQGRWPSSPPSRRRQPGDDELPVGAADARARSSAA